ncbi:hypothetical protein [Nocardioides piscis]|uniref:CHRD domain-containing protein n=1 Tax=Nocardioides piscis TaxID=2714938 RepID=A0A6G7YC77_9ACTN|nr:hypothetical protein [Nocardioides piscis]QIK74405.1 hypothetical protein G7071_02080 [Nocardioides piscis]
MQAKTKSNKRTVLVGTAFVAAAALGGAGILSAANATDTSASNAGASAAKGSTVRADLNPLNNSGVMGKSVVESKGRRLHVTVKAHNLAPNLPHAQHIHFGATARNECPSVADDTNGDVRLTTVEGVPAYGPVRASLTTNGDTSAKSVLAVDRYPTAENGHVRYERTIKTGKNVARAIRQGKGVVVIHGVDYNNNGTYDFDSAGKSELDKSLPAEATDPAVCGVLRK